LTASVDDFDDAMRSRIDQDGLVVNHRVAIFPHAIFRRDVVIGHAFPGKLGAHGHRPVISIRAAMLMPDVVAKARLLIDAKQAGDAAADGADSAADNRADRAGVSIAFMRPFSGAADNALGAGGERQG